MIANVILNNKEHNIDRSFDYIIPSDLRDCISVGIRVLVPFGRGNRYAEGIVISVTDKSDFTNLKKIQKAIDHAPIVSESVLKLCLWMKRKYFCSFYQALRLLIPPGLGIGIKEKKKRIVNLIITREEAISLSNELKLKRANAQASILDVLIKNGSATSVELSKQISSASSAISALLKKGYIEISSKQIIREAFDESAYTHSCAYTPTDEQKNVIDYLSDCIEKEKSDEILLRGVTGSGKTEVFLQTIAQVIKKGKNAIMLVPEISLTPQMVERFVSRFGNRVAVMHSGLSYGERFDQWNKIKNGEVTVVVGARSAIFAPFENIGIIILDEEHENSYKSDTTPKYHAREIAEKRIKDNNALLLLASATPSVSSYYYAKCGKYTLYEMHKRYNNMKLPEVKIVDMRTEIFQFKNFSSISLELQREIRKSLDNHTKTILFLNRRGYSTFVSCRQCGYVVNCPDCSIAMTYHKTKNELTCHYCGKTMTNLSICPECGSKHIKYFGTGTQKIEEELLKLFPDARILRMDTDTTSKKGGHEEILSRFGNGDADILLGTQMVTKGLDFPDVTLVGVLAADTALCIDDFRANERSFSLFTQVCGRAGRGNIPGKAVIQTYQPQNSTIAFAKTHNYTGFFESEIMSRKHLNYPPFCNIICIMVTGKDENFVNTHIQEIGKKLKNFSKTDYSVLSIIGPMPAPINKIKNDYRYRIIIKAQINKKLYEFLSLINNEQEKKKDKTFLSIDINPINLY